MVHSIYLITNNINVCLIKTFQYHHQLFNSPQILNRSVP